MKSQRKAVRHLLTAVVAIVLLALSGPGVAGAQAAKAHSPRADAVASSIKAKGNPRVLPPNSKAFGKTYGGWSAEWWNWALTLPAEDNHPLIANGKMDCTLGQKGKVWFLGGTYAAGPDPDNPTVTLGTADRTCEVPTGKALYFPIINIICSEATGDGTTKRELDGCANFLIDEFVSVDTLSAKIDGQRVDNLQAYRTVSGLFTVDPLPDPNLLDTSRPTTGPAVTSGYYLLLAPLSKGEHTIEFKGKIVVPDVFEFALNIRYELTVVAGR